MSSCIDTNLIELIVRNVIARMIQDHTLQAGLRNCAPDCSWLGHETRVATCDQIPDIDDALDDFLCNDEFKECVQESIDDSLEDFLCNDEFKECVLATIRELWPCGDFTHVVHDDTLVGMGTECVPLSVNPEAICFPGVSSPATTNGTELPTYIVGSRMSLLGTPDGWMEICGRKVPYWN